MQGMCMACDEWLVAVTRMWKLLLDHGFYNMALLGLIDICLYISICGNKGREGSCKAQGLFCDMGWQL